MLHDLTVNSDYATLKQTAAERRRWRHSRGISRTCSTAEDWRERTWHTASSSVCLHPVDPWSCCDLDLWPSDPKTSIYPCPKMHECWKFGEIQSSNFREIALTRPNRAFSASWTLPWPWTPTFWPQNLKYSSLSKNASQLKVWRKHVQYFQDRLMDTHRQPQNNASGHIIPARGITN